MKNKTKILLLTSLMTLIASCSGGGGGSSSDSSTRPISDGGGNPQTSNFSSLIASAPGGWKRDCMQQGDNLWTKEELKMQGNNIVQTIALYENFSNEISYCVEARKLREDRYTFTATTGQTNSTFTDVDFTFNKVEIVLYNRPLFNAVESYNQAQLCGKSNWVAEQWEDVSSTPCAGKVHQIFKVVDNRLYFGKIWNADENSNGSSKEKRPTSLQEWGLLKSGEYGASDKNILDQIIQAGTWSSLGSRGHLSFSVDEMEIVDGNFVTYMKTYQYENLYSSQKKLVHVVKQTESIYIDGASTSISNAINVRLVLLKREEMSLEQSRIDQYNNSQKCGASDWKVNEFKICSLGGEGITKYTVFKISEGIFYQGRYDAFNDGSTALKRPTQLGIDYLVK